MSNLELIPIRESDRMADEMLSLIVAGSAPSQPACKVNNCTGNTGICTTANACNQNTGNCESNGCQINQPKPEQPTQPDTEIP